MAQTPLHEMNKSNLGQLFLGVISSPQLRALGRRFQADPMDYLGDVFERVYDAKPRKRVEITDAWLAKTMRLHLKRVLVTEAQNRIKQGDEDE